MKGVCILYPCYFNSGLKREQGRKVPLSKAVKNPTMIDLENALRKIGVKFQAEQKHHPCHWVKHEGRILAEWSKPKNELLKRMCGNLEVRK